MASIQNTSSKNKGYRVAYTYKIDGKSVRREKYTKTKSEARVLLKQLEQLESAARTGMVSTDQVKAWVSKNWLRPTEAMALFPPYAEIHRLEEKLKRREETDYEALEKAALSYASRATEGSGGESVNYQSSASAFRRVFAWLRSNMPSLDSMTREDVSRYHQLLLEEFAPWTVFHRMTKLRIILDCAEKLGMVSENWARTIPLSQPKRETIRQILSLEEINWVLDATRSPSYTQLLNGTLPIVVRLGLYAGLRPIEMCWATWDWVDWSHKILNVQSVICRANGQRWSTKSHEARAIDMTDAFYESLESERERQRDLGILNQFILPAGTCFVQTPVRRRDLSSVSIEALKRLPEQVARKDLLAALGISLPTYKRYLTDGILPRAQRRPEGWRTDREQFVAAVLAYQNSNPTLFTAPVLADSNPYLGRPMGQRSPQQAFFKFMEREGRVERIGEELEPEFSLYNLRHTFITRLLLPLEYGGAGLDVRTVQMRAGHANLRTTENYLRDVAPMQRPINALPY